MPTSKKSKFFRSSLAVLALGSFQVFAYGYAGECIIQIGENEQLRVELDHKPALATDVRWVWHTHDNGLHVENGNSDVRFVQMEGVEFVGLEDIAPKLAEQDKWVEEQIAQAEAEHAANPDEELLSRARNAIPGIAEYQKDLIRLSQDSYYDVKKVTIKEAVYENGSPNRDVGGKVVHTFENVSCWHSKVWHE